jgi:hypothetical protein
VPLAGLRAVIAFDTPQRMIDGNWIQSLMWRPPSGGPDAAGSDPSATPDRGQTPSWPPQRPARGSVRRSTARPFACSGDM